MSTKNMTTTLTPEQRAELREHLLAAQSALNSACQILCTTLLNTPRGRELEVYVEDTANRVGNAIWAAELVGATPRGDLTKNTKHEHN